MKCPIPFAALCLPLALAAAPLSQRLQPFLNPQTWQAPRLPDVTRDTLEQSLRAARDYFLAQQRPDGNFTYALDIPSGETANDDNQVRQAGAFWGLALLHTHAPTPETRRAIVRAIDFFARHTRRLDCGETAFAYPGDDAVKTGTIAILTIALLDVIQDPQLDEDHRQLCRRLVFSYLAFLRSMELDNGSWASAYILPIRFKDPDSSPYYDGEALLAYTRAARALNRKDLLRRLDDALPKVLARYTADAWDVLRASDSTKGFAQWGAMACAAYLEAGWKTHAQTAADAAIALAYWQLFENQIELRRGNTAYAVEGLAAACQAARLTRNRQALELIEPAIRRTLARLTLCQFKGPFMSLNPHFRTFADKTPAAAGGITDSPDSSVVRIDIVQHQVHAILLSLRHLDWK